MDIGSPAWLSRAQRNPGGTIASVHICQFARNKPGTRQYSLVLAVTKVRGNQSVTGQQYVIRANGLSLRFQQGADSGTFLAAADSKEFVNCLE